MNRKYYFQISMILNYYILHLSPIRSLLFKRSLIPRKNRGICNGSTLSSLRRERNVATKNHTQHDNSVAYKKRRKNNDYYSRLRSVAQKREFLP